MCNLTIYWKIFYRKSENVYLKFDRDSAILSCDNDDLKSRYKSFLQFIVFYLLQWIRTGKKRKRLRKKSHILVARYLANNLFAQKEVFILRKKSHILLARYLADQMPATKSLQSHRKAFCLGSILPDIKPSFLTKKHEYFGTFEEIQGKMKALIDNDPKESKERVYWRRFGEVMHYMADYFTFPHNTNFTGNLYEHNKYEKHLKNHLKRYIESGAADRMVILPVNFGSFRELVEYIGNAHERYLLKERNIAEDVQYILRICSQVIHGILQLAAKQFGREDILIPAAC